MIQEKRGWLGYRWASVTFLLAYVVITIIAIALALFLEALLDAPPTDDPVHSASYVLAEKFYPFLNLVVWTTFAWVYFKKQTRSQVSFREAFALGVFWLMLAIAVDYVGFVLIRHPYSLNAHDFYVGQFPWIYLIYLALLVSPACYVAIRSRRAARS
ncbi:MAG: hypothetical protein EHM23_21535 [Acidobacteria bacterium]|nr:MAG: hypothetical protein EHM23_21535 [Acidobacteriota bacterium]